MKVVILICLVFFTKNILAQNYIFQSDKNKNPISFYNNSKIIFFEDKIKLIENGATFYYELKDKNNRNLTLKLPNSIKLNYYLDTFKIEDLTAYYYVEYGDVRIEITDKIEFNNLKNNKLFINGKEDKNNKNINNLLNDKTTINNLDTSFYRIDLSSFIGSNNSLSGSNEVDEDGNIYFSGFSSSNLDSWIKDAYQKDIDGGQDYFVIKMSPDNKVIWGTYVGCPSNDGSCYLDVKQGMVWVVGESHSNGFPLTDNAFKSTYYGKGDITIFRLNYDGKFEYGTYNGGNEYDTAIDVKIDDTGNTWVCGRIYSPDGFKVTNNAETKLSKGGLDGFVMCFDKNNNCIYSTRIGGYQDDFLETLCITKKYVVCGGYTRSNSLINLIKQQNSSFYLTALDRNTFNTVWTKKFEDNNIIGIDEKTAIQTLYSSNNNSDFFYASGFTYNKDFGTDSSYQSNNNGGLDYFIRKINEDGTILNTTYLGGISDEGHGGALSFQGGGITSDYEGNIYVSGNTISDNFPIVGKAIQSDKSFGSLNNDIFIAKFSSNLTELLYSTYFGGDNNEMGRDILWSNNSIYLSGWTQSSDFYISDNAIQKSYGGSYCAFILKLSTNVPEPDPCNGNIIEYQGFSDIKGLKLVSDAVRYDSTIRLTKSDMFQKGAVWLENPYSVSNGFTFDFTFETSEGKDNSEKDGFLEGADGYAFVIQGTGNDVIGYAGGGIGYEGLKNALAIEIDLYYNNESGFNDPNGNHLAVFGSKKSITADHNSTNLIAVDSTIEIIKIDKTRYYFKAIYQPKNKLFNIYLNEADKPEKLILTLENFDLSSYIDLGPNNSAYFGITSATGSAQERHEIKSLSFCGGEKVTGVEEEVTNELLIYPNPAKDYIYITKLQDINFEVIDLVGNTYKLNLIGNKLDISNLARGIYFIKLNNGQSVETYKFIKE